MQKSEAAAYLAGAKQVEGAEASAPTNLHVISGEVIEKSEDGKVKVDLGGLVFSEDDEQAIEIDTLGGLEVGDTATILLAGQENRGMTPLGIGGVGTTDRVIKKIEGIEADYVKAELLETKVAQIGFLKADSATITQLQAQTAKIQNLTAEQLSAATAYIAALTAGSITAESLTADVAKVHNLTADQLSAAAGYISQLTADSVTAQNISAMYGDFATVKANAAKVANLTAQELEADHATIASLDSNYAHITNGVIDNAKIGYADVNNLDANYAQIGLANVNTAQITNGVIQTASIVDEQVFTVSGNKATLAEIDASKINVANLHASNLIVDKLNGQPVIGGYSYISKNSSGYSSKNPKSLGWYELTASGFIKSNDTTVDPDKAYYTSGEQTKLYDQTYIDNLEQTLDDRIDGAIETFTSSTVPTPNNYPASDWTTDDIRATHVGDVCYVLNEDSDNNGWCYRYAYNTTTHQYGWTLIKDSDVTAALSRLLTVEGVIGDVSKFDEDIATFLTDENGEFSRLQTRTTSLETSIGDKVDSSTFNRVSQKVDANEASITTLTATTSTLANPNLSPFYSNEFYDGTYWSSANSPYSSELGKCFTQLEDGWAHVDFDNSARDSSAYHNIYVKQPIDHIKPDTKYTFVYEVRNLSITGSGTLVVYGQDSQSGDQMASHGPSATITEDGVYRVTFTSRSSFTDAMVRPVRACLRVGPSTNAQLDVRASLYEGEYSGPYKPYINAYTVTTISNTVNEVKQTATSNSTTISQLTRTLGTNLDGTTAEEDIVHKTSAIEQDLDQYKTTVSSTYATKTALGEEVSARETAISQLDNEISLNAKRTESLMTFVPTKHPRTDTDFWYTAPSSYWVTLDDGWYHLNDYTAGSSVANFYIAPRSWEQIIPGEKYTFLIEIKNYTSSDMPTSGNLGYMQEMGGAQFWGNAVVKANGTLNTTYIKYEDLVDGAFTKRFVKLANEALEGPNLGMCFRYRLYGAPSRTTSFDIRISVYPGDYEGPYNEYLTATSSAQLMVANDEIAARVEKNGVIAAINASVEEEGGSAVKIIADKVNIEGAAIFTSDGRLSQTSLDNAYDSKGSASDVQNNLDNLQIGGRNLLPGSADWSKWVSSTGATIDGEVATYSANKVENRLIGVAVTPGETYTVSVDIKADTAYTYGTTGNTFLLLDYGTEGDYSQVTSEWIMYGTALTTEWKRVSETFTVPSTATIAQLYLSLRNASNGPTYHVRHMKLEKGTKPTDWTPAPEDQVESAYATCSTAAGTAAKVVAASGMFDLHNGVTITVKFTTANTADAPTLNVNDTGAYPVWNNNAVAASGNPVKWSANATLSFIFDGSHWVLAEKAPSYSIACSTAATTRAKAATINGALVINGTAVAVLFSTANTYVADSVQFNLSGTGAANIYLDRAATSASHTFTWSANTVITLVRYGAYWYVSDGRAKEAVSVSQRIYYRSAASTKPDAPTAWVEEATENVYDAWTTKVPPLAASTAEGQTKYSYLWTCEQREAMSGAFLGCTDVQLDENTTVIDGGTVITHSITATQIDTDDLNVSKTLTVGAFTDAAAKLVSNSEVVVGGRNLFINTSNPDVSDNDSKPRVVGTVTADLNHAGTASAATHGMRLTSASATQPRFSFGKQNGTTMMGGLEAGETYTFSADIKWKVYSSAPRAGTIRMYFYNKVEGATSYANTLNATLVSFTATECESEDYIHAQGTLTIPDTAIGAYLEIRCTTTTSSYFAAGDFIELANMKLEKGNKATDWSPAPEDVQGYTDMSVNGVSGQLTDVNDALTNLQNEFSDKSDVLTQLENNLKTVQDMIGGLQDTTSWLTFTEGVGLVIGDTASETGSYFFTQQTGQAMSFNQMTADGSQQLMVLSGTNGVQTPRVTAEEVVTDRISSDWAINLDGDMFSIDYIGS